jgi:hypothetical protein
LVSPGLILDVDSNCSGGREKRPSCAKKLRNHVEPNFSGGYVSKVRRLLNAGEIIVPTFQTSGLAGLQGNENSRLLGATSRRGQPISTVNSLKTARSLEIYSNNTLKLKIIKSTYTKILRYKIRRILWGSWCLTKIYNKLRHNDPLASPSGKVWIGGFPRSGNTFASSLIEYLTKHEHVEKHLHSPAQILQFIKSRDSGGVVIRNPTDACVSLTIYSGIDINDAIQNYIDFYELLDESKLAIKWIYFDHLIKNPLHIIELLELEEKLNSNKIQYFREFPSEALKEVNDRIDRHWSAKPLDLFLLQTARPTTEREGLKDQVKKTIFQNPSNKSKLETANNLYRKILLEKKI